MLRTEHFGFAQNVLGHVPGAKLLGVWIDPHTGHLHIQAGQGHRLGPVVAEAIIAENIYGRGFVPAVMKEAALMLHERLLVERQRLELAAGWPPALRG